MLTRLAVLSLTLVVVACSSGPVDKVCTVNVKTEKAVNGVDLKPETDAKTMVLSFNKQAKVLKFNDVEYKDKDFWEHEGVIHGTNSSDYNREFKMNSTTVLKYHLGTGVIDVNTRKEYVQSRDYREYEHVSINGTCK